MTENLSSKFELYQNCLGFCDSSKELRNPHQQIEDLGISSNLPGVILKFAGVKILPFSKVIQESQSLAQATCSLRKRLLRPASDLGRVIKVHACPRQPLNNPDFGFLPFSSGQKCGTHSWHTQRGSVVS